MGCSSSKADIDAKDSEKINGEKEEFSKKLKHKKKSFIMEDLEVYANIGV